MALEGSGKPRSTSGMATVADHESWKPSGTHLPGKGGIRVGWTRQYQEDQGNVSASCEAGRKTAGFMDLLKRT